MAAILFVAGAALLIVGVAFIFWPAALIVAGVIALASAAFADLMSDSYEYDDAEPES